MKTYKVIRFYFDGEPEVQVTGITLEEAQAHCRSEDTHGDGWFDGYEVESYWEASSNKHSLDKALAGC